MTVENLLTRAFNCQRYGCLGAALTRQRADDKLSREASSPLIA